MRRNPFTLVEVLIAMSVLSVFLLGLMQFYSSTETVLNSGLERAEMFERARIAMDMMANDLTCTYYSQTDDDLIPFRSGGSSFEASTVRPEKVNTKAKTNIVGVRYALEGRKLVYSHDTKGDTFSVSDASFGDKTELVDGVTKFEVTPIYGKSGGSEFTRLPVFVVIRMALVDKKTMKRLEANSSLNVDNNTREFRRMIMIDRGQTDKD